MWNVVRQSLLLVAICFVFAGFTVGDKIITGGEIPWPLSSQKVVTVEHSQGLWKLESVQSELLFNVEMEHDEDSCKDWIRVSQLDPTDYSVMAWGEGSFGDNKGLGFFEISDSYSNPFLPGSIKGDKKARYLKMFVNGESQNPIYQLRMVEVETAVGRVLGISVVQEKERDHYLGTRVMDEPFLCSENLNSGKLSCELP